MTVLTITHSDEAGTLLEGTSRGDGSAQIVKALRWRWGRSIGCWYVPRSRFAPPKRGLITAAATALETAGFTVVIDVEATPADPLKVEAIRVERGQARAEKLTKRADRHEDEATGHYEKSRALAERIPFGQPILVGHHSQGRAERDAVKMRRDMDKSIAHTDSAEAARQAARSAAGAGARRNAPVTVANRIERMAAEIRSFERTLSKLEARGTSRGSYGVSLREHLEHTKIQVAYWHEVRVEQIRTGLATNYSRETVSAGDQVQIRGHWCTVVRANAKTVAVQTPYSWTDKSPWHEVQAHRSTSKD